MKTEALGMGESEASTERLRYGAVELDVTDAARAAKFWSAALGLEARAEGAEVHLQAASQTLIVLRERATRPAAPHYSGLYHVAIGVPTQAEFSRLLARLLARRLPFSPVDHLISKAIYLQDPDGLGVEIAYETPQRFGRFGDCSRGYSLYDREGRPHSGRAPLDVAKELPALRNADPSAPIAPGACVAHLHLQVPDLMQAVAFFEPLGFARNLMLPQLGFADLGAGGPCMHRLALNVWRGHGLPPAPEGMARLARYALKIAGAEGERRLLDPAGAEVVVAGDLA